MRMLHQLLSLSQFNGNRLAEALGVHFQVLSRRKKDGAFSKANYHRLQQLYRQHVLNDNSAIFLSQAEHRAIEQAAVDAYKKAMKARITETFCQKFKEGTIMHILRLIDSTQTIAASQIAVESAPECVLQDDEIQSDTRGREHPLAKT